LQNGYVDPPEGRPGRADIEQKWLEIIRGSATREEVHEWAEPLMLGDRIEDLMVASALEHLHGFDLTGDGRLLRHGPPGEYIRSIAEIVDELNRWRQNCDEYDADPEGWVRRARARGWRASRREQRDRS
jgi:hypothetical protein